MKLRRATLEDADLLLEWRNDLQTIMASHNVKEVSVYEHKLWLAEVLDNPDRNLLIAEASGTPVGTVRADYTKGVYELSWTVAPSARGTGVGKKMVATLARQIAGPIRAEVRAGNESSSRIAEHAGMKFTREDDGVLHYQRAALNLPKRPTETLL